ncbi:MAG: subclass B1 metallo-beta-lactamase [Gemmatimonadota bacterium]
MDRAMPRTGGRTRGPLRTAGLIGLVACTGLAAPAPAQEIPPADRLTFERLADGVWMHTSWTTYGGVPLPSNGLIVQEGDGLVLIDTAWGADLTRTLLAWIDTEIGLPVVRAYATHFHDDRLIGSPVLAERGIPFYALPLTIELAADQGVPLPRPLPALRAGEAHTAGAVEIFFPGGAHTRDNITVWVPSARLLFGGCAVRPADTDSPGNTADADVEAWPRSIARLEARYPEAALVVPSHGPPGGVELLAHTRAIFGR